MPTATQPGSLEAGASATDLFRVTCFDDGNGAPASLVVQLTDTAPVAAPLVAVQIQKGAAARSSTDATDGDATPSPAVFVNGGATGTWNVLVDKTAAGAETYTLTLGCMTAPGGGGVATGISIAGSEVAGAVPALTGLGVLALAASVLVAAWLALRRHAAAALLVAILPATSSAHDQTQTLGSEAAATDFYQVTCSDDGNGAPGSLLLQVETTSGAADLRVSAQAQKGLLLANTTDPVNADESSSPFVWVNGGTGVYNVLVDKSSAGDADYTLRFHCQTGPDGTGVHTGTTHVPVQDQ